ncbi:MAG: cation:proton antiporter, partial [Prevotella denticola]
LRTGAAPVIAACTIIFCMMALGVIVGYSFGWKEMDCIFLGGMLAMSSTTIIYKAFSDMGLTQKGFASTVMSVLILEDILAIVMMVMLSTLASGASPDGVQVVGSILKIGFFLVLWFVVGLFVIPLFLRSVRKILNNETLLVVALGLCCLMAVVSTQVGFSAAFGAFVMGSILAETVEADKIIRLVDPVKNLFGAVFFVSVGMLVNPKILAGYAVPILLLVLAILAGQAVFGTLGYLLGGQTLKNAMRCGFSMAQVGEFAFIIASLGLSLHVISDFLYPVVVAVSVITTFLTPYMIRAAEPCYDIVIRFLPKRWVRRLTHIQTGASPGNTAADSLWKVLARKMLINTLVYGILSSAVIAIMFSTVLPVCRLFSVEWTGSHWAGNAVCGFLTVAFVSPFLRSIVMKQNHSEAFKALWTGRRINRLPLIATILARVVIAVSFIFYICNYLTRFQNALIIAIAVGILVLMILSRRLKKRSITLERLFIQNLRSRDIKAQLQGKKKPLFADHLIDRDIHIANLELPDDSLWAGRTLRSLQLRNRFGVHVSSILRGSHRMNIPNGNTILFPGDKLQAIGDDEQLTLFSHAMKAELQPEDTDIEKHEMKLRCFTVSKTSPFIGKTLRDSGIRDKYNCMVVGVDEGQKNLTLITPSRCLQAGDVLWVVGEQGDLDRITTLG